MTEERRPSKAQLRAMREERIFDFCITHARQIIGELETSGGHHGEDVEVLEGLIETWGELRFASLHDADHEDRLDAKKGEPDA